MFEQLNVSTQEELYQKLHEDMTNYNILYEENVKKHGILNTEYIGILEDFFEQYEIALTKLSELKQQVLQLINISDITSGQQNSSSSGSGLGITDGGSLAGTKYNTWANVPGVGLVPVTVEGGKTQQTDLPEGTIIYTNGGAFQITGGKGGEEGYTSEYIGEVPDNIWTSNKGNGASSGGSSSSSGGSSSSSGGSSSGSSSSVGNIIGGIVGGIAGGGAIGGVIGGIVGGIVNGAIGNSSNKKSIGSYSNGIEEGPVTTTGLAMLHGTYSKPEYVLNNDQAWQLLRNFSTTKIPERTTNFNSSQKEMLSINGDIILNDVKDPSQFWDKLMEATRNRFNVTKRDR